MCHWEEIPRKGAHLLLLYGALGVVGVNPNEVTADFWQCGNLSLSYPLTCGALLRLVERWQPMPHTCLIYLLHVVRPPLLGSSPMELFIQELSPICKLVGVGESYLWLYTIVILSFGIKRL